MTQGFVPAHSGKCTVYFWTAPNWSLREKAPRNIMVPAAPQLQEIRRYLIFRINVADRYDGSTDRRLFLGSI
jgi:hypothetical protein